MHIYKTAIQKHISYINHVLCFADFATMSKRLGELWATVPTNEKYVSPCMYLHMHIFKTVFRNFTRVTQIP